ncbi:MAG: extracellular solute-binding protein [Clostridium sp.]|jgi:ABC-type glycerol-3-phosphate transport system substrate-binding protein|nr:extracellular solute-binding protein [Clostridium sp.]
MKKETIRKIALGAALLLAAVAAFVAGSRNRTPDYREKYEGYDLTAEISGLNREGAYSGYRNAHADTSPAGDLLTAAAASVAGAVSVAVDVTGFSAGKDVEIRRDPLRGACLYTGDDSTVTWEVEIPEAGWYALRMEYLTVESRGVAVERRLLINGELPFTDAGSMEFSRLWTDEGPSRTDNQGNEIRSRQVEVYDWQTAYFRDDMGYVTRPYEFWFGRGSNTITLEAAGEPVVIGALTVEAAAEPQAYDTYRSALPAAAQDGPPFSQTIQGEDALLRSESSLYAKYDRSSPTTQPNSVTRTVLNYIGGDVWGSSGQWIEWECEVPRDGYYLLTVKGRQNYSRGAVSVRRLYIDGAVPFREAEDIRFEYGNDWKVYTLSDEDGNPYQFYLTAGRHRLRLEAALGGMGTVLEELEDSTFRLNQIYRRLLIYLGATPDQYRDYHVEQVYPDVLEAMELEAARLYSVIDRVVAYTGQKADKIAAAQTLAQQLERFVKHPERISVGFVSFKDNITSLGSAALSMSETKLDVDYLVVSGAQDPLPQDRAGILAKAAHEIKSFAASFVVDYDSVGDVYEEGEEGVVKVWIVTGRDQGTILKSMVDDTFTFDTGIKVNVEIIDPNALLSAVVAGRGPNVVVSSWADQPVNYALRGAAEDLTQFEGWEEVFGRFYPSAYRPYEFEGGIYAVPETQTYNVMFYRKDVLEEIGLGIPDTWEELIEMLPTIQGNNLSVGIPSPSNAAAPTVGAANGGADLSMYYTLVYQNGSDLYDEEGRTTLIDNEAGVEAFASYTKYFTDYGVPAVYDFVSRFRTGEMPIGITGFQTYNTLMVSAPEIKGLWDFTLIPGTIRQAGDGSLYLDRSVYSTGNCTLMIRTEEEEVKRNAWEFMKWWAEADTQIRFGREQEALLGSSARYAAANVEAFRHLAWSSKELAVLGEQWGWSVGFQEVAGGYYTGRHIMNAARKVLNDREDPRETIVEYAITINEELTKKRREFGLPVG